MRKLTAKLIATANNQRRSEGKEQIERDVKEPPPKRQRTNRTQRTKRKKRNQQKTHSKKRRQRTNRKGKKTQGKDIEPKVWEDKE